MNITTTLKAGLLIFVAVAMVPPSQAEQTVVDKGPDAHLLYLGDNIDWKPGPASLEKGAEVAVLEGNPSQKGVFTLRLKLPDGFVIAPHTHPNVERVTVLSGTFLLGMGDKVDHSAAKEMKAGSYTAMPPGMVHHAVTRGTTVVQLTSVGPWVINYVRPEDDPRGRE